MFLLHSRDSVNEISLIDLCKRDLGPADRHVLNIHDLEAYNKVCTLTGNLQIGPNFEYNFYYGTVHN